jgi:signal transduction histidine kinase
VEGGQLRVQSVLKDIAGSPVLVLETNYVRSISAAGNSMVNYVLALMGGVLATTGLAILLMLNRTVLKPVARLMDRVLEARGVIERPQAMAEPGARDGDPDEIAILGTEFERTLAQLEETRNRLVEQSFYTGAAELVGGMTHNVRNALTPISIKLWHIGRALDMAHLDKMEAAVGRVAEATADRRDCALAVTYLKACMEHLRSSHSTIETDIGVIGDQATHIEQIFYDHEKFSRAKRQVETIDVVSVVEEASKLLRHGDAITIEIAPGLRRLPQVRGHHVVLTQVFGNLVVNAEEAILAGGRATGKIMIEGKVVTNDGSDMVELHFTDDGQGIPEDKLDRIFERGYSTRRAHSGGIGLHWCANSLAGMGGGIWAISDGAGRGATMVVRLPVKKRVFKFDELRESA